MNDGDRLIILIIDPNKIHDLINRQEKYHGRKQDLKRRVRLELSHQLMNEQVHEAAKLHQVNAVPEILKVSKPILFHLHNFKENEETLRHKTENVAQILKQEVVNRDRENEGHQEAADVELDDQIEELFGLEELEVD